MRTMLLKTHVRLQQAKWSLEDKGATAVEYGLLVALIALVIIAAVTLIGTRIQGAFDTVGNSIP